MQKFHEENELKEGNPNSSNSIVNLEAVPNILPKHVNSTILFFSQMTWFFYMAIIIFSGFLFPKYHPAQIFVSSNEKHPFDKNEEPLIFSHLTDIHLTVVMPERTELLRKLLDKLKEYKVNMHIFTGDYVHNYEKKEFPKVGSQVLKDWILFQKLIDEKFRDQFVIDIQGNHDAWSVGDPLGKESYFLDYSFTFNRSNVKTERDLFLREEKLFGMNFLLINNYRYPNPHPPYHFYSYPSKEQLDIIEDAVLRTPEAIVLTHYPIDYNWHFTSSRGNSYEKIMQHPNVKITYAGHLHPHEGTRITYHGQGTVEYVGMALKDAGFGFVTFDNGRHVYNTVKGLDNYPKIFITNPIPLKDISSHQIFNVRDTPIRVISYFDIPIDIFVKGDVNGKMQFQKQMKNGAYLYFMDFHAEKDGLFNIEVYNDQSSIEPKYHFSVKRTFYIGQTYQGIKTPYAKRQRGYNCIRFCYIPIFFSILIMLFPYNGYYIDSVEKWIEGGEYNIKNLLYILFLSPFIVRYRILKSPKYLRKMLFICFLLILFIPMHFYQPIGNLYGFSFLFYTYLGGSIKYDRWCLQFNQVYLTAIILPIINFVSTLKYKNSWVHKYNTWMIYIFLIAANVVNYRWVGESLIIPFLILNPIYVIIPGIIQYILYKHTHKKE